MMEIKHAGELAVFRAIMEDYHQWLLHMKTVLPDIPADEYFASHPFTKWNLARSASQELMLDQDIQNFWHGLNVLSKNYEELCDEWNLPTHLAAELANW